MSSDNSTIDDNDLHAYVDGHLSASRRAQVEFWLSQHPTAAERVKAYQQQNELFHAAYDTILDENPPARLQQRVRRRPSYPFSAIAASLLLGIGGGWLAREAAWQAASDAGFNLPADAAIAHVVYAQEVLHPVEVGADQQEHLVKWLSKRLNAPLRAPDLRANGFQLEGGRLLPASNGPAAQFMYRNEQGLRLSLYLRSGLTENSDTAFRYAAQDRVSVFYWVDHDIAYALSGEFDRAPLLAIAETVYQQLN